jgi:thiamine kinase-like enzyme
MNSSNNSVAVAKSYCDQKGKMTSGDALLSLAVATGVGVPAWYGLASTLGELCDKYLTPQQQYDHAGAILLAPVALLAGLGYAAVVGHRWLSTKTDHADHDYSQKSEGWLSRFRKKINNPKLLGRMYTTPLESLFVSPVKEEPKEIYHPNSSVDALIQAGIPEEALASDLELWSFLQKVEKNEMISANQSFYVTDKNGQKWLLKTTGNEKKAKMEAAANYYLGQHFDFIVPGKSPQPISAGNIYLNLQRDISSQPKVDQPLEYWIACLAAFHGEAENIMHQYNQVTPIKQLRGVDALAEDYAQAKQRVHLKFDRVAMAEAIDYLTSTKHLVFGHGDNKLGNRLGRYLVDLEGCGMVHPGIDISLLLMEYGVPQDQWGKHLSKYLELRGFKGNLEEELKSLQEGTLFAARYTAFKEVLGSSLRKVTPEVVNHNVVLAQQFSYLN